jgi:hypothetical protein
MQGPPGFGRVTPGYGFEIVIDAFGPLYDVPFSWVTVNVVLPLRLWMLPLLSEQVPAPFVVHVPPPPALNEPVTVAPLTGLPPLTTSTLTVAVQFGPEVVVEAVMLPIAVPGGSSSSGGGEPKRL